MRHRLLGRVGSLIVCLSMALPAALAVAEDEIQPIEISKVERTAPVDFGRDIAPILSAKCLACHSASAAEGDLVLESPTALLKGGGNGPAAIAGKAAESLVLKLAAHQAEPLMPPPDNDVGASPLTPAELGLLALWINQGARAADASAVAEAIAWQPLPAGYQPLLAVAVSPDGQYVACSRGNQIHVYHLGTGKVVARLVDPALSAAGLAPPDGAADVDLVQSLAFAPDGRTLASGGYRTVRLWQRGLNTAPLNLPGLPAKLTALAVSPTGDLAVIAGELAGQFTVQIVRLPGGQAVAELRGHSGEIAAAQFSANGDTLFTAGRDGALKAWNTADGAPLASIDAKTGLRSLALAGNGQQLVAAGDDGKLRVWTLPENVAELATLAPRELGSGAAVNALAAFGPAQLVAGGADGVARLWDLASSQPVREWKHEGEVVAVAARADGSRVAAATSVGKARLWAPDREEPLAELARDSSSTRGAALAERLLGAVADRAGRRKSALEQTQKDLSARHEAEKKSAEALAAAEKTLAEKTAAHNQAKAAKESADKAGGDAAAAAAKTLEEAAKAEVAAQSVLKEATRAAEDARDEVRRAGEAVPFAQAAAELAEQERAAQAKVSEAAQAAAQSSIAPWASLAFSPDGKLLLGTDAQGAAELWDAERGSWIERLAAPDGGRRLVAFTSPVQALLVSGTSAQLASVEPAWSLTQTIGGHDSPEPLVDRATALAFSPDGALLAMAGGEPSRAGELELWNVAEHKIVRSIPDAHSDVIGAVSFSPDGRYLATGAADRLAKLIDLATGKVVRTLEGHTHHVLGTAWRGNLFVVATSSADGNVKLWNSETGEQLRTLTGFGKEVTGVRFVAGSPHCVAASGDATIRLFNTDSGSHDRSFGGSPDFVQAMDLSLDGATLAAGGEDGVLRVWKVEDGALLHSFPPPGPQAP